MIEFIAIGTVITISAIIHTYSLIRIHDCVETIKNLPTTEEIALEILKTKLPIESLPEDLQTQIKQNNSYIG